MPELPEVETVARELLPLVSRQQVSACYFVDPFFSDLDADLLVGLMIQDVKRVGKQVVIVLTTDLERPCDESRQDPLVYIAIHLRMTGRLLWRLDSQQGQHVGVNQEKHVRAKFVLATGTIIFQDVRRFGTIKITRRASDFDPPGIDPMTSALTPKWLFGKLRTRKVDIKSALLNQQIICGIGNIYASEILYAAAISPFRLASSLTLSEVTEICRQTKRILTKAIKHCGTTFSDFQRAKGLTGRYQRYLKVYAHAGDPCKACQLPITKAKQSGRSTYYCLQCQR